MFPPGNRKLRRPNIFKDSVNLGSNFWVVVSKIPREASMGMGLLAPNKEAGMVPMGSELKSPKMVGGFSTLGSKSPFWARIRLANETIKRRLKKVM